MNFKKRKRKILWWQRNRTREFRRNTNDTHEHSNAIAGEDINMQEKWKSRLPLTPLWHINMTSELIVNLNIKSKSFKLIHHNLEQ